jgi:hypothetical protein
MAQPSWVTGSGSLGTIPEGKFYRANLEAYDPDFPSDSTKVKYIKISGSLPQGIHINNNGIIEGTPVASVQGIPVSVSENVTSKFSIRVYTETIVNDVVAIESLSDRTFTITITGQDAPEFVTPSGDLGSYFDGQLINKQIEFTDTDPSDTATVSISSGGLPPGVSINSSGLIYGYIKPMIKIDDAIAGWENTGWDSNPLQFNTGTVSRNYQFTLKITDGTDYNLRTFSFYVGVTTVDSTAYTSDSDAIRADTITRAPFIQNYIEDLGTFTHNNYFSHQFQGVDYNNDILHYAEGTIDTVDSTLTTVDLTTITADHTTLFPNGLELDVDTGFLHGTLSNIGLTEREYNFSVTVYKKENVLSSNTFNFKIKIVGDVNVGVTWNTDTNLGTINNGDISAFNIDATSLVGTSLKYRLKSGGSYNKLPQGLSISPYGNIIGRVSYQMFGLIDYNITSDSDTTIDTNLINTDVNGVNTIILDGGNTTVDSKFTFTVEAYSANLQISTFKTFDIEVNRKYNVPTHDLHIDALISQSDRVTIDSLLQNQDIIKEELLYRSDDPYYGVSSNVTYVHAYGLSPETMKTYAESLEHNHYNKRLVLGEVKTAQALNAVGDILYEVVYSDIIDNMKTIPQSVSTIFGDVYPNSLDNMRNRVIDKTGQVSTELPTWMLSKQPNGNILGFTTAWVIAYTLPGQSNSVAYNISRKFGNTLNKINFVADRYTLQAQFTQNWDAEDQRWYPTDITSFDIYNHGISADSVDTSADVADVDITADLTNASTIETTFDKRSCVFIGVRANKADITTKTSDTISISADNGSKGVSTTFLNTDKYNKYLLFPKQDIINTKQTNNII